MRDLRSVCRRQMELVITMPHKDKVKKGNNMNSVKGLSKVVIRIIP